MIYLYIFYDLNPEKFRILSWFISRNLRLSQHWSA